MNKSENTVLTDADSQLAGQLSLLDVIVFIRRNLGLLIGGALAGGTLALALAFILPAEWEAGALIRVGQFVKTGQAGETVIVIEPPLQVVDRIKNKSFQNDVLRRLGVATDDDDRKAREFRTTLRVKLEKSELISLTLKGRSPDEAKQNMGAVISELKRIHLGMSAPIISLWQKELASIELELSHVNTEAERLAKSLASQSDSLNDGNFSQAALLSNVLIAREGALRSFRDRKHLLEEQLSPERTFVTDLLGRIEVSTKPVFPKKPVFVVIGLVIGLFLVVFVSIMRSLDSRSHA